VVVPRHKLGNWEAKPNYLAEFQYVIPGTPKTAILNSCNDPGVVGTSLQCSGHGKCRAWNDLATGADAQAKRLSFCECDRDYADPECTTPRKSQLTAFVLAVFLGPLGADQLYLGFAWEFVVAKLLIVGIIPAFILCPWLLGGLCCCCCRLPQYCDWRISWSDKPATFYGKAALLGLAIFYYLYDVCRIGSSTVLTAHNFRVASDLSHFTFVLSTVSLMLFFGFAAAIKSIHDHRRHKAHELLLLRLNDNNQMSQVPSNNQTFSGYGATVQDIHRPMRPDQGPYVAMPEVTTLRGGSLPPVGLAPPSNLPVMTTVMPPVTLPPAGGAPLPTVMLAPPSMAPVRLATPSTLLESRPAAQLTPAMSPVLPQVQGLAAPAGVRSSIAASNDPIDGSRFVGVI